MKKVLLLICLQVSFLFSFSQDFIVFTNGELKMANVVKITLNTVFAELDKFEYEFSIDEIAYITFENNKTSYFNYDKEKSFVKAANTINKGMAVYVVRGIQRYSKSAKEKMVQRMCELYAIDYFKNEKVFNVVYTQNEAHLLFEIIFSPKGRDGMFFVIRNKDSNSSIYRSSIVRVYGGVPEIIAKGGVDKLMEKQLFKIWDL